MFLKVASLLVGVGCMIAQGAEAPREIQVRGTIAMDYRTEVLTYGLKIGNPKLYYLVDGFSQPNVGVYMTESDFNGIRVSKNQNTADGTFHDEELETKGSVEIYPRRRFVHDLVLAGLSVKGEFLQGAINDGIFLNGLEIDGQDSRGLLDYNNFVGYYRAKRGLRFGDMKISSSLVGSNVLSNLDNYLGQNRMRYSMKFGDLVITGLSYYSDSIVKTTDSDGDTTSHTVATACRYNLSVQKADGSAVVLAGVGEAPTPDDFQIRKFIAMLLLFSYDMHR